MKEKCIRIGYVIQPYGEATQLRGTDFALFSFQCGPDPLLQQHGIVAVLSKSLGTLWNMRRESWVSTCRSHTTLSSLEVTQLSTTLAFLFSIRGLFI
jgi:hypothetical protein